MEGPHHKARVPVPRSPNIILFMPDELRADALGCYGNALPSRRAAAIPASRRRSNRSSRAAA